MLLAGVRLEHRVNAHIRGRERPFVVSCLFSPFTFPLDDECVPVFRHRPFPLLLEFHDPVWQVILPFRNPGTDELFEEGVISQSSFPCTGIAVTSKVKPTAEAQPSKRKNREDAALIFMTVGSEVTPKSMRRGEFVPCHFLCRSCARKAKVQQKFSPLFFSIFESLESCNMLSYKRFMLGCRRRPSKIRLDGLSA